MGFPSCDNSDVFQWPKLVSIGGICIEPFSCLHHPQRLNITWWTWTNCTPNWKCWSQRPRNATRKQQMPSPAFRIGNHVYVKAKFFCTTWPLRKLAEKNLGLFKIIGTPGTHSITVCLPQQFWGVHHGETEYEVSEILNSKLDHHFKTGDALHYLIHWVGYKGMDKETSWEQPATWPTRQTYAHHSTSGTLRNLDHTPNTNRFLIKKKSSTTSPCTICRTAITYPLSPS